MKIYFWTIIIFLFFVQPLALMGESLIFSPGKLLITGFNGTSKEDVQVQQLRQLIDQHKVGGVILYGRNIRSKHQLKLLIEHLSENTDIFVAIDHEGGFVNRLRGHSFGLKSVSPEAFCKLSTLDQYLYAEANVSVLKELGINVNFGGVLDLKPYIHGSSVCNDKRCFSESYKNAVACYLTIEQEHKKNHIIYARKHYPGHGSTVIDSHYSLPNITTSHSDYEYMPYIQLSKRSSPYDMVMVGHLLDHSIDPKYPASLSFKHIDNLKRRIKYSGFVITDDLNMGALRQSYKDKSRLALQALSAGNHLILFEYLSMEDIRYINREIKNQLKEDSLLKQHIEFSLSKVLSFLSK